ncbi:MAG TPA: thioredoxin domain-containing protein, partial [Nitrospiraceae bacterium]
MMLAGLTQVIGLVLLLVIQMLPPSAAADIGEVTDDGRIRGRADAPVTLIEYSDFTCGYCLKFFRDTWPKLQAKYVETGKLRFVYRDYPRADRGVGVDAAVAARCAGAQGRYWAMHDRLFGEGARLDSGTFRVYAKAIGLD